MKQTAIYCLLCLSFATHAQTANRNQNPLVVNFNIAMLQDSVLSQNLISSLNDFLYAAQQPFSANKTILASERLETGVLLDEFQGIEKSRKFKDDFFYKPYLSNILELKNDVFLVQLSYIGTNEKTPYLTATYELLAQKVGTQFMFYSPLKHNTKHWKTLEKDGFVFHYKRTINTKKVREFVNYANFFDKKLNNSNVKTEIYCAENFIEAQQIIGLKYQSAYNGYAANSLSFKTDSKNYIAVLGLGDENFNSFDPHDLWHDRLSLLVPRSAVNKPIDEGCAYLYGGSWGISWEDILKIFYQKIASKPNNNWADYKENPVNFGESQEKDLQIDYVINALLVQKIEKEKGFASVWQFLNCGKQAADNANYYQVLEKLTGINATNYNQKIDELVKLSKK